MRYLIAAGCVFSLGVLDGLFARQEAEFARYEQHKALEKKASLYAGILAACFNGNTILVEDHTEVLCKQRPLKHGAGL